MPKWYSANAPLRAEDKFIYLVDAEVIETGEPPPVSAMKALANNAGLVGIRLNGDCYNLAVRFVGSSPHHLQLQQGTQRLDWAGGGIAPVHLDTFELIDPAAFEPVDLGQ